MHSPVVAPQAGPEISTRMEQSADRPRDGGYTRKGLQRLISATGYSLVGLRTAWRNEEAFRQEALAAVVLLPLALWLGDDAVERILLAGSVLLVLIVELLNTAVEFTVDRIGTEPHKLSGRAKDLGSAAVMLSLLVWGLTWGSIAWERLASG